MSTMSTIATLRLHTGDGEWDGTREESAVVWIVTAERLNVDVARSYMQGRAKNLARAYQRDAIAVIVGDSTLVEGR